MYPDELTEHAKLLLKQGCEKFGLTLGIISHICYDVYEIVAVFSADDSVKAGASLDLKDTYCREVVTTGTTVAITEIEGKKGMQNHPLYNTIPLEAYISTPITYKNEIWGTLNFSSHSIRENDFSKEDIDWVEYMAKRFAEKLKAVDY